MNVSIKTIPASEQRYATSGDWWFEGDNLEIRVTEDGNWKYEMLVAVHELCEVLLCKDRGITQESVDAFDIAFEAARKEGNTDEPGDEASAPYQKEHFFASNVERLLAAELKVNWKDYDSIITQCAQI